jgi:hypothetical protein
MLKSIRIEERSFASVAEAVSHYYLKGFESVDWLSDGSRYMRRVDPLNRKAFYEARISHPELLTVDASVKYIVG